MAAAQLWLLRVLAFEFVSDTVKQANIALLRVLLQRGDERPRHGARGLSGDLCVLGSLVVFAPRPHDDVGGRCLGDLVLLVNLVARCGFLEKPHGWRSNATYISTSVLGHDRKQALPSLLGKIWFLENTLSRVDVWQVECGAGVAGVEDGGQAHTWLEGLYHDAVHLIVNDVACYSEVDGVDDFVVAVVFVAVKIRCLPAVACNCQY